MLEGTPIGFSAAKTGLYSHPSYVDQSTTVTLLRTSSTGQGDITEDLKTRLSLHLPLFKELVGLLWVLGGLRHSDRFIDWLRRSRWQFDHANIGILVRVLA